MLLTHLVGRLGRNDVRLIGRDRFLIFMFAFAAYIAIALRYLLPWADGYLREQGVMPGGAIPIPLSDVFPMLVAYMGIFTGAMLVGTIFGFMLLDEKENSTLLAMLVTPVPIRSYLLYRVGLPAVLSFFVVTGMLLIIGQSLLPIWQMSLLALGGSLTAPIFTLFFATIAENKVQGFAYAKFGGVSGWIIMIGFFITMPWQWLFGLFPPFWISKAYWLALEGSNWWWGAWLLGITLQIALIGLLMKQFSKVIYR